MASLLRTETITHSGIAITVQCPTLLTMLRKTDLEKRMTEVVTLGAEYLDVYLNIIVLTQRAEGLPFALPAYAADVEAHLEAFEQFLNTPGEFQVAWNDAINRLSLSPSAPSEADASDPKGSSADSTPA